MFKDGLNKPNGLALDRNGSLIVCEGGNGRLISIDRQGKMTVLVDQYGQKRFNEPNDLWIDPQGGIYFTDPAFRSPVIQDGENVYYLIPDHSRVIKVIDDLIRPNGIVGSVDGKTLYVADYSAGKIFVYDIMADGTISNKKLFVPSGSDGMKLDQKGNLFITTQNKIQVYSLDGEMAQEIPIEGNPTNLVFIGDSQETLFITARESVYLIKLNTNSPAVESGVSGFTLTSPDIQDDGRLPVEYTCDGASSTLPLDWSGTPAETQSYALIMHHEASPQDIHWYWILYDIPFDVSHLAKNVKGIGTPGTNGVNDRTEYAPPCSKGPGEKVYIYTLYALSTRPQLSVPASQVNRDVLLKAIQNITLASTELKVTYARKSN